MHHTKKHMHVPLIALFFLGLLLFPTSISFYHVFQHHKHDICIGDDSTHIHQVDLDCEYNKFKIHTNYTFPKLWVAIFSKKQFPEEIISYYFFLSKYQHLHFSLRGPPSLV
ncbi:hypothetical protein KFZ70_00845 [Tamlana fucoidanivorans]|uniref:Uncharacterized protein n=1 Tax=Allotamlana fucoidanivorans TaxID=2583814 RepID=A0A5C4SM28_9FLAO|nr:hypothetical protein [Tamlana fucoidanivorans]TNJ44561.1 hypothetical protein FGF67_07905 [Tamlana fucoidanivorans]